MRRDTEKAGASAAGKRLKTIFCGTPEFAVPTLRALIDSSYSPVLVLTQPDRPCGRGQRVTAPPVKRTALEAGIPVHQPDRFNTEENLRTIAETGADLAVVVAYSAKIGTKALELLDHGWLNLHPSLLPAYRGAAPIQWALIRGEKRTGNTTFFLNEEWDAGPICLQEEIPIGDEETYGELARRCSESGARLVLRSIREIEEGTVSRVPQDDSRATFAPLLKPEDSVLDWRQDAWEIHGRVRGLTPKPGLFMRYGNRRIQILKTGVLPPSESLEPAAPGRVVNLGKKGLYVSTGSGVLEILRLKPENKAPMTGLDFRNRYRVKAGDRFE